MIDSLHSAAAAHLPSFIAGPGESDWLMTFVAVLIIGAVLAAGVFFFWLHSIPERMVHNRVQFDIVAVLALLSLFTHIHAFWVAALILALVDFSKFSLPDFSSPLSRMAGSLETLAAPKPAPAGAAPAMAAAPEPAVRAPTPAPASGPAPVTGGARDA